MSLSKLREMLAAAEEAQAKLELVDEFLEYPDFNTADPTDWIEKVIDELESRLRDEEAKLLKT